MKTSRHSVICQVSAILNWGCCSCVAVYVFSVPRMPELRWQRETNYIYIFILICIWNNIVLYAGSVSLFIIV